MGFECPAWLFPSPLLLCIHQKCLELDLNTESLTCRRRNTVRSMPVQILHGETLEAETTDKPHAGRVYVVTGCGSGIGRATAIILAKEGVRPTQPISSF
jgi:hypothetical protein